MTQSLEQKENLHSNILSLLDTTDIYKYKDMLFINKKCFWYLRKIYRMFSISEAHRRLSIWYRESSVTSK